MFKFRNPNYFPSVFGCCGFVIRNSEYRDLKFQYSIASDSVVVFFTKITENYPLIFSDARGASLQIIRVYSQNPWSFFYENYHEFSINIFMDNLWKFMFKFPPVTPLFGRTQCVLTANCKLFSFRFRNHLEHSVLENPFGLGGGFVVVGDFYLVDVRHVFV